MNKLHIFDIAIIIMYLIVCLIIGYFSSKKVSNIQEYTLGRGKVSTFVLVSTMLATWIGAATIMGTVEKVHELGLIYAIAVSLEPFAWLTGAYIFTKNILYFKQKGCLSIGDIMDVLYGKLGRWAANIMSLCMTIGIVVIQITAIGYLGNYFLGIPKEIGGILGIGILMFYTCFGGVRAVILTDVMQAMVFFIGIPYACYILYAQTGGYEYMSTELSYAYTNLSFKEGNLALFISLVIYSLLPPTVGPYVQRCLMAENPQQLNRTLKIGAFFHLPFGLILCAIGFIIRSNAPDIESNMTFFYLIEHYLPIGAKGLLVAGLLAAIMSSADSYLNNASIVFAHDILKDILPNTTDKQELQMARLGIVLISITCTWLALSNNKGLLEIGWLIHSFYSPVIFIPLSAGFLKFRTNSNSFIGASVLGILCSIIGRSITGEFATISMVLGMIGSTVGLLSTHYIQKIWGIIEDEVKENIKTVYSYEAKERSSIFSVIFNKENLSFKNIIFKLAREVELQGKWYHYAGAIGSLYFIFSLIFWPSSLMFNPISLLKIFAGCLCAGLCLHEYFLTTKISRYIPLYYYITLMVVFPMLSTYMLFAAKFNIIWIINWIFSILLIYSFVGWKASIILSGVGSIFASFLFFIDPNKLLYHNNLDHTVSVTHIVIGVLLLFSMLRQRDMTQRAAIEIQKENGQTIAHRVLQPITYFHGVSDAIGSTFNTNAKAELTANGKSFYPIDKSEFDRLKELTSDFKNIAARGEHTVRNLLNLTRSDMHKASDLGVYTIEECVLNGLDIHLKTGGRGKRIKMDLSHEFNVRGSKFFISEMISTLVENAFKHGEKELEVKIWTDRRDLHIRDNGIAQNNISKTFNKHNYLEGKIESTNLGMAFCHRVIEAYGGMLKVDFKAGEYTEVIIMF